MSPISRKRNVDQPMSDPVYVYNVAVTVVAVAVAVYLLVRRQP